jgi:Ser/Thr protein kinase RdoA (MazF antagonist)
VILEPTANSTVYLCETPKRVWTASEERPALIKEINDQFHDVILQEAAGRYGVTLEQLQNLGGFESFVYAFSRDGQGYILKITHTMRRSESYIMGELEWLNFLADRGVAVARAVPSEGARLIERIAAEGDGAWLVMAYAKAPGHRVTAADWNGDLFATWGRLIGKMHRLTQSYQLANPAYKRQEWYQEEQLNARKYLPAHEAAVIARADELMAHLRSLPTPADAYGLIHTDLHHGNLFVDEGRLTAFDFDDIGYNWFASDIAVILMGAISFPPRPCADVAAFAQSFLSDLFRGYAEENTLDPKWVPHIREFMLLRDLLLFITVYQIADVSSFNEEQRGRLDEHRRRALEGRAPVELDWALFAKG